MTAPKPKPNRPLRKAGRLVCNTCKSSIPYSAIGDPELDMPFPQHRCGWEVRPFDRWVRDAVDEEAG